MLSIINSFLICLCFSHFDGKYRCPREVSTIVCVHDPECLDPTCSNHGSCDKGICMCTAPWTGETCNVLNCSLASCSNDGVCVNGESLSHYVQLSIIICSCHYQVSVNVNLDIQEYTVIKVSNIG